MNENQKALIALLEHVIVRVENGEIKGLAISYMNNKNENRIICSEGDIEVPERLHEEMDDMAQKILNKVN